MFILEVTTDNKSVLVQVITWRRAIDKPLLVAMEILLSGNDHKIKTVYVFQRKSHNKGRI